MHYLCTVKSKLMFHSLNFTIMDDFWNEYGKGIAKGLGVLTATAIVVGGVTLLTGGSGSAAALAIVSKIAGTVTH